MHALPATFLHIIPYNIYCSVFSHMTLAVHIYSKFFIFCEFPVLISSFDVYKGLLSLMLNQALLVLLAIQAVQAINDFTGTAFYIRLSKNIDHDCDNQIVI